MDNQLSVDKFVEIYQKLDKDNLELLTEIYAQNIHFIDPLHEINGLEDLRRYFRGLYIICNDAIYSVIPLQQ